MHDSRVGVWQLLNRQRRPRSACEDEVDTAHQRIRASRNLPRFRNLGERRASGGAFASTDLSAVRQSQNIFINKVRLRPKSVIQSHRQIILSLLKNEGTLPPNCIAPCPLLAELDPQLTSTTPNAAPRNIYGKPRGYQLSMRRSSSFLPATDRLIVGQ